MHCYGGSHGDRRSMIANVSEFESIKDIFGFEQKTSLSHRGLGSNDSVFEILAALNLARDLAGARLKFYVERNRYRLSSIFNE